MKSAAGDGGVNWRENFQGMQAAMARALELVSDSPDFVASMDGAGFPWVTVPLK